MSLNVKHQYVIEFGEGSEYEFMPVSEALYKALKEHFNPSLTQKIPTDTELQKLIREFKDKQIFPPIRPWKDDIRPDINPLYPPLPYRVSK